MKTLRQQMIAKLHIILKQQNAIEHKAEIYAGYGVTSSRDMTDAQLSHLIGQLEGSNQSAPASVSNRSATRVENLRSENGGISAPSSDDEFAIKKLRSEILSLLTKSPRSTNPRQRGLGIPNDWAILNPFIVRHGHKLLFQMSTLELENFHRKLLAMRDSGWAYRGLPAEGVENLSQKPITPTLQRDYLMMPTSRYLS